MSTEAPNAVIVALASLHAGIDADEATAKAAASVAGPDWRFDLSDSYVKSPLGTIIADTLNPRNDEETGPFMARYDPARAEREVEAKRLLIAAIVAEPHLYVEGDSWYSCSQAVVHDPADDEDRIPGSGCLDDTRRGQPCDCGRDARVERLLGILAGIYDEETEGQQR